MAVGRDQSALKLFISYSRADATEADAMVAALETQGFEVAIDRRDLPFGEEWQGELREFILNSDTVVWLVSPASIGSRWVNWELGEVQRANKRLMPVVVSETPPEALPGALGKLHLLPAEGRYQAAEHLTALVEALLTDRSWIKEASRLSDRAREWIARGRSSDRLLRGAALRDAAAWRGRQPGSAPQPTQDVLDLIAASERGAKTRARWTAAILSGAVLVTSGLAVAAVLNAQEARDNAALAAENEAAAVARRDEALRNESRLFAAVSGQHLTQGDWGRALYHAWSAAPKQPDFSDRPLTPETLQALTAARQAAREAVVLSPETLDETGGYRWVRWSAEGEFIAAIARIEGSGASAVWSAQSGERVFALGAGQDARAAWSGAGAVLAVLGRGGLSVHDAAKQEQVCAAEGTGRAAAVSWSPDDQRLALVQGARLRVVDAASCQTQWEAAFEIEASDQAAWSPDGRFIAANGLGGVWDAQTGALVRRFEPAPRMQEIEAVAWSPDSARLAVDFGPYVSLLDASDWLAAEAIRLSGPPTAMRWRPDGAQIALGGFQGGVRLYHADGREEGVLRAGEEMFTALAWSPDGARLAAAGADGAVTVWEVEERKVLDRLWGKYAAIDAIAWSPDGARLAIAGEDDHLRLWTMAHRSLTRVLAAQGEGVRAVAWSPDGAWLASGGAGEVIIWRRPVAPQGGWTRERAFSPGGMKVDRLIWVEDGARLLVGAEDAETESLWDPRTGERLLDRPRTDLANAAHAVDAAAIVRLPEDFSEIGVHAWRPDASYFARQKRSDRRMAEIWDTRSGMLAATLAGHELELTAIAFSPDGALIATGALDGTVRLWPHWPDAAALIQDSGALAAKLDPLTLREKCRLGLVAEEARFALCRPILDAAVSGARY